jgi:hypothetical protein
MHGGRPINARDEDMRAAKGQGNHSDLSEAADRAGAIVTDQIRAMLDAAESRAREIRRSAEKEARERREAAAREASALFKQLEAIERPLDALASSVRGELDSLSTEFRRHWTGDDVVMHAVPDASETQTAGPADAEPEQELHHEEPDAPVDENVEEHVEEAPPAAPEAEEVVEVPDEEQVHEHDEIFDEPVDSTAEVDDVPYSNGASAPDKKRGLLGRLKRRKSALFISTPGQCAVCYRSFAAGSEEALEASGWKISGELGLCPQCQEDGWQLPEGARLPYRRAAT